MSHFSAQTSGMLNSVKRSEDERAFWSWLAGEQHEPKIFIRTDWEQI